MKKTVLVLGSGGREHALAWKLARSPQVGRLMVAPGNDAWGPDYERWPEINLSERESYARLAERARQARVDLAVIGPDNPLADGLADVLISHGVPTFGPSAAAARIEASKAFAKEVMQAAGVPTARFFRADSVSEALSILDRLSKDWGPGWVVKCDGLALGKGVRVCAFPHEARDAVTDLAKNAGASTFVIEERLFGEELSWMALCDGKRAVLLDPARDHKRLGDADTGPNTGGMGAFSPVPGVPAEFAERMKNEVFLPVLRELERRGAEFKGVLYAGLMWNPRSGKFWVLEFNARFGDPEAQVLLTRMEDDLFPWCEAAARCELDTMPEKMRFSRESALIVVGAAAGYPDSPERDQVIACEKMIDPPSLFWGGVRKKSDRYVTAGGRVFGAVGTGASLAEARTRAYARLSTVQFSGMQFRSDIGASSDQPVPIAVLASGRGSNFEAIQTAIEAGALSARIVAVLSDKADAPVLAKARAIGLPALSVVPRKGDRAAHEEAVLAALRPYAPHFLVLAGYMRILSPKLLQAFRSDRGYSRVVNIHPSLLPSFSGAGGYRQAFEHGAQLAGASVHLVDESLDGGPICAQEAFSIADCRTVEEVERRGLVVEHRLYPEALRWILSERFVMDKMDKSSENRRARVRQN
ncbi:MAG: hypothetical protein A2X94_02725 [Bdellovibrionales bacterium GWB1_55_8]|nr:MAG: hypothetical protein A2X94_02725 [Bdellovibrionales bacterium GWB1_55_8]